MVRHLHIGWQLRCLGPSKVLTQIYKNSVKKLKPPEWPLLEVRRFFQWCQEMSLGILRRFQGKKVHYFFRVCNFGPTFGRLLQLCALKYALALSRWRAPPGIKLLISKGVRYDELELLSDVVDPWDFWTNNDDIMRWALWYFLTSHIPRRDAFPHVALQQFVTSPVFLFYHLPIGLLSSK